MAKKRDENPVVLSRIYTRTGDDGTTGLGDMSRTDKTDPRLAAYADVEEANAAIGLAVTMGGLRHDVTAVLARIQNELFDVGADLCTPVAEKSYPGGAAPEDTVPPLRIDEPYVTRLEAACDLFNADLAPLRSFILPGGAPGAALLHMARTVVRRSERAIWQAIETHGDGINPLTARYLNRLSDLLFILCRIANAGPDGESVDVLWKPGGDR
jgi:cob(I)alamin adenosyltransferase